jgi:hypothetical protein
MIIVTKFLRTCCGQATVRGNSSKADGPFTFQCVATADELIG